MSWRLGRRASVAASRDGVRDSCWPRPPAHREAVRLRRRRMCAISLRGRPPTQKWEDPT